MNNITWIEPKTSKAISDTLTAQKLHFSTSDVNRIENNTQFIIDKLQALGLNVQLKTCMNREEGSLLTLKDLNEIVKNVRQIADILKRNSITEMPKIHVPKSIKIFSDINQIEEALLRLKLIFDNIKYGFSILNTFYADQKIEFPKANYVDLRVQKYVGNVESGKFSIFSLSRITE